MHKISPSFGTLPYITNVSMTLNTRIAPELSLYEHHDYIMNIIKLHSFLMEAGGELADVFCILRLYISTTQQSAGMVMAHYGMLGLSDVGLSENSVPHCTQWFSWSLSLWKMAISLGIWTQHFQTNPCLSGFSHIPHFFASRGDSTCCQLSGTDLFSEQGVETCNEIPGDGQDR